MKSFVKSLLDKNATVVVLLLIAIGSYFWWSQQQVVNEVPVDYSFIIQRFTKKSELVVAAADVETVANKKFSADITEDWPNWTKSFSDLLISRKLVLEIPVKTEFKLQLEGITKDDIRIENEELTFIKPIIINVDSQQEGQAEIQSSSTGIVDKAVDLFTTNKKSMEFLEEKSQDAIFKTSEEVMNDEARKEKVAKYAAEALENLINLDSDQKLIVKIDKSDLIFKNIDPQQ